MQLCMWSIDKWEKLKSRFIQAPAGRQSPLVGETKVQFHNDQTHLLVVHESQISVYDSKLECSRSVSFLSLCPYVFGISFIFLLSTLTKLSVAVHDPLMKFDRKRKVPWRGVKN